MKVLAAATAVLIGSACGGPPETAPEKVTTAVKERTFTDCGMLAREARRIDSVLQNEVEPDTVKASEGIRAFLDFAYHCSHDTNSAIYLIKTAQVARAINQVPQAKEALDRCIADYPDFSGRPAALFLLAQLYDEPTYLNNEYEAQQLYDRIIDEYPRSEWAASARGAKRYIGKTDADILNELKQKQEHHGSNRQ